MSNQYWFGEQRNQVKNAQDHGGELQRASLQSGLPISRITDFSSNLNPLGPPPGLLSYLCQGINSISCYPEPQARRLRDAIGKRMGLSPNRLVLGNGANDLLHFLLCWKKPSKALIPVPSFSEYYRAARLAGAQVEYIPLPPGQSLPVKEMGANLGRGDWLIIGNPQNPTGAMFARQKLKSLVHEARKRGAMILLDESFLPLTQRQEESLQNDEEENLWVVVSLTKCWSLPGLRLGYLVGPEEKVLPLQQEGDPWRVNALAQHGGLFCLQAGEHLQKARELIEEEKKYLRNRLTRGGLLHVFEGEANFLLVKVEVPGFQVEDLYHYLLQQGFLIRRGDNFQGLDEKYFRLAVRKREDNQKLVECLEDYLDLN